MKRSTVALDRIATLVVGLAILALGVLLVLWWYGHGVSPLPATIGVGAVLNVLAANWWPWVTGVAAIVLVLLGLRWLTGHVPDRGVGRIVLPGSDGSGRLQSDAGRVASAAAELFESARGVRSSRGTVLHERGQTVARFTLTVEPDADLAHLGELADRVTAELSSVLGRQDLRSSVLVRVASRAHDLPRVS